MKLLKIVGILVVLVIVVVVGAGVYVNHYVQTPEFKQQVLDAAHRAVGTEVKITTLEVSLLSGIDLTGVTVANPAGFSGDLLTAKSFALHYRLLPLLSKRVEVETLSLDSPTITMAKNAQGEWNYDKLGAPETGHPAGTTGTTPAPTKPATPASSGGGGAGLDIAVQKIVVKNASFIMLGDKNKELLKVTDANLSTAVEMAGDKLSGTGKTSIGLINAANSLFVRDVAAPLALTPSQARLAPLSGKAAGGDVSGSITAHLTGGFRYDVELVVKDAQVVKLLDEAGVNKKVFGDGKLELTTALSGTAGLATMVGTGRVQIVNGTLVALPLQELLATVLQVPALRTIKFDECLLEFSLKDNVMQTPVIKLTSPLVRVTGQGKVNLADNSLDHDLTLALAASALANVPKEVRSVFTQQSDGFSAITFHVSGPYDSPKTDLATRLATGAIQQYLPKVLPKLFK